MALASAAVIDLMNRNANRQRAPNCRREACMVARQSQNDGE